MKYEVRKSIEDRLAKLETHVSSLGLVPPHAVRLQEQVNELIRRVEELRERIPRVGE